MKRSSKTNGSESTLLLHRKEKRNRKKMSIKTQKKINKSEESMKVL
jgi:hypothetical protein